MGNSLNFFLGYDIYLFDTCISNNILVFGAVINITNAKKNWLNRSKRFLAFFCMTCLLCKIDFDMAYLYNNFGEILFFCMLCETT